MPKKKREKKSVDGEPSKKFSENEIDTSGSIGSPGIIGEKIDFTQNINIQKPEPKPIRVRPNRGEESLMWIGKRIMRALFGTLIHSMTGYAFGSSGIAGLGIVFSYFAFTDNPFPLGSQPSLYLELASLIVVILGLYLGPLLVIVSRETQCPNCHARFSFYEKERLMTTTRKAGNILHRNFDTTSTCDECGHTEHDTDEDEVDLSES